MRIAVFSSARFRPYLPDQCQVNPNVLGFELAEWLSRALAARRVIASYPSSEDWGWYLESGESLICCSGGAEEGDRYEWRVFVDRPRRWFRRQPPDAAQERLFDTIVEVLRGEGIAVEIDEE
jgi:hypothetical protein